MPDGGRRNLPHPSAGLDRLLRSSAGGLLLRPWFDDAALRLLTQWYFPLSRGWAAALTAKRDVDTLCATLPVGRLGRRLLPTMLARLELRQKALADADARWEEAFFGSGPATADAEAQRRRAAVAFSGARSLFVPLHLELPLAPIAWAIETPDAVAQQHAHRLAVPEQAFAATFDPTRAQASRGYRTQLGIDGWLRFASPAASTGTAWARVSAPLTQGRSASPGMPSLVFSHGIAMETEFNGDGRTALRALVEAGIRVIRPEGPWHGRRRQAGFYGGEPVLARGLAGLLDYFHAHVLELGCLVAWARATRGGPVAIGGVSLGALTAQLAAVAARHWPPEMRPDALFLVAPSRSLTAVTFQGSLTGALGVPAALTAAGWSMPAIDAWRPLLEPVADSAVAADRTVVVLGESDDVTLTAGGEALIADWRLPKRNVFRSPAGHFSTSLGLARDHAPLHRLIALLLEQR